MKFASIIACGCAALLSVAAFAEVRVVPITVSTGGPDTYADGTTVLDGECYALVWVKRGKEFAGFTAEGKMVDEENNLLVCVLPRAKNGRCEETTVQIEKSRAEELASTGSYVLALLDTRSADKATVAAIKSDLAKGVQGYGEVDAVANTSTAIQVVSNEQVGKETPVSATQVTALPDSVRSPVIKSAEVKDGVFIVTVEQTVPFIRYNLAGGETPAATDKAGIAEAPKAGNATQTIELKYPIKEGESVKFFKVTRDPISK